MDNFDKLKAQKDAIMAENMAKVTEPLLSALEETLDALCNETAGKRDSYWIGSVKAKARAALAAARGGVQ